LETDRYVLLRITFIWVRIDNKSIVIWKGDSSHD
jgi:hypothetical protein